jgi:protein-S-isoprenylcysteine O-methyltransferase Ste14
MYQYFQIPINTPADIFYLISSLIVVICTTAIFIAVLIDFTEFQRRGAVKKEKKSIVETGTMFLFFFLFYLLIRFKIGQIDIQFPALRFSLMTLGCSILMLGCLVNIKGRFNLGKNWSNQIKIYDDHSFVSRGVYRFVRHPLYASIIWMFFGASLIYSSYAAFFANLFIFIPFMYYRAKQEEGILAKEFADYKNYQIKVGMFFPRLYRIKYEKI